MSKKQYTGILIEPIQMNNPNLALLGLDEDASEEVEREVYAKAVRKRLDALYTHYGEKQTHEGSVAVILNLAFEHIPGFRNQFKKPKKAGRKTEWTSKKQIGLVSDVGEYLLRNPTHGELTACRNLLKKGKKYGRIKKPDSLFTKHLEFKKRLFRGNEDDHTRAYLVWLLGMRSDVVELFLERAKANEIDQT